MSSATLKGLIEDKRKYEDALKNDPTLSAADRDRMLTTLEYLNLMVEDEGSLIVQ